jgi:chromosome segregation ATPase
LDDSSIISAGAGGAVYERYLSNPTARAQEYFLKGVHFSSALCTEDEDHKIYAVGDDRILKEIIDKSVNKYLEMKVERTQLAISHPPQRMLFAGTANGVVRSFKFPLTGEVKDYQCHSKRVLRMRVSHDDRYLFSAGEDGCLAIFKIKEKEDFMRQNKEHEVPYSEEILVTKSDLEEKNQTMADLKRKMDELTSTNQYQLRLQDMTNEEKLKERREKYNLHTQHEKSRIEMLRDEKNELQNEFDEKIMQLQTDNNNKLHKLDLEHQKAIMQEVGRYQQLTDELEEMALAYSNTVREEEIAHQEDMAKRREKFEMQLKEEKSRCAKVREVKEHVIRTFKETKSQLEEDTDKEIEHLKQKYNTNLHEERDATLRLKGENGIMRKKFSALEKDIEDQKENIKEMNEEEKNLKQQLNKLDQHIKQNKEDIEKRDRTIGEKEKQIYDLKKDNQELEKFKFVLDYQIKELKRQIEPRENEIADMKERVMKMDGQLEAYHKANGAQQQQVKDLTAKLQRKQQQIRLQRQRLRKNAGSLDSLANDLHQLVQVIQNPTKLKEGTKALYYTHVTERIQAAEVNPDVSKEYKRQRQYLERSVDVLKRKLGRDMKARKSDNMRVMQENVALIKEINKMRREIKLMHQVQRQRELNNNNMEWPDVSAVWDEGEAQKILQMQRENIETLRMQIEEASRRLLQLE